MKAIRSLGIVLILSGLLSCTKEKDTNEIDIQDILYDTIKPLDYFPAFPGSYWVYDNNDTLKVADQYEKYIFNAAEYSEVSDYETLILPKLILNGIYNQNDSFAYVKGYSISKSKASNYRDPAFKEILSLTEGAEFTIGGAIQGHKITGKTIKVDTTILIENKQYNNVIITLRFDYACISGSGGIAEDCATLREYYAKYIGLIKREKRNYPIETMFTKEFELVDYKIKR